MRAGLALLAAILLSACSPGQDLPELKADQPDEFRLGPGDTVRLITFGEDQLTGEFASAPTA